MPVHRIGFTELSGSEGTREGRYRVNIIFVHGLRGHPQHTWEDSRDGHGVDRGNTDAGTATSRKPNILALFKSKPSSSTSISTTTSAADNETSEESPNKLFWPDEFLTQDIPEARIWTYGYNADAIGGLFQAKNTNSVSQHGRDLEVRLERDIQNKDPILFVAHSLGGIIVKDAIRRSDTCRTRTKLVIFLGTPHRGSAYAGWGEIASNLALLALQDSNKRIIKTLEVNSEVLDNIHEEFKTIADQSRIRIHSFQEARGISGMKGLHNKVVDDFSSKLDLPRSLETVESIDANHMQMARCGDRSDPRYRAIVGVLQQFIHPTVLDGNGRLQEVSSTASRVDASIAEIGGGFDGTSTNRATLPCHYIPFSENKRFVGRNGTLEALQQMLFIRRECQKVAIVGLGGVGKTQVALQLAYWAKKHHPEYSILWVPALSGATFEQAFTEIARKLPIQTSSEDDDLKDSVRRYLSSEVAGKWFLVVDNVDDMDLLLGSSGMPGGLNEYIPESEDGIILFTTRSRKVAVSMAESNVIELVEMDLQEGKIYLEKSLIRSSETETAELLEELMYLPLAITQAAAYLNTTGVPITEYLRLLRGADQDTASLMSREFHDGTRYKGSQNAVATTWLVSFEQIRKSDSAAADLLSFMSCIEPKGIPQSILPRFELEEQMVYAVGTLCGYAFLTRRGDSKVFDMHSLVHLAARIWIQREGRTAATDEKATRHLATIFPNDDYTNRDLWREYLPHAFKVLRQFEELDIQEKSDLSYWVGRCLTVDGRIKEAVRYLEAACRWRNHHFPEAHPSRLTSQHGLAGAYWANGQVKEAIALLEQVVAIRKRTLAEDHPDRLTSQHALAIAYEANGQIKEAIALLEQVIAIRKRTLTEDHPSQLASQHTLAIAYWANGQVKEAIALLEQVVAIHKRTLAEDHPSRLASQHTLAGAYEANGQVKEAIALLKQVVTIRKRTLAEDHPDRLTSQHRLAIAYRANGQIKEAITLFEQVVAIQARTLAKDHPDWLVSQHGLAIAYRANGQIKEAIALLEQVVAIQARTLAEDHPSRLASQHTLAIAYVANGQIKEAIALLEQVVAIQARTLAEDHPSRLASQQWLTYLLETAGSR